MSKNNLKIGVRYNMGKQLLEVFVSGDNVPWIDPESVSCSINEHEKREVIFSEVHRTKVLCIVEKVTVIPKTVTLEFLSMCKASKKELVRLEQTMADNFF